MIKFNQSEKISKGENDREANQEKARKELKDLVVVYAASEINSQAAMQRARALIEHLIFQLGSYRLEKGDWVPYLVKIKAAAEEAVEGYVGEIRAYNEKFQELIADGETEAGAERELREDSQGEKKWVDLTKAESFFNLKRILEEDFLNGDHWTKKLIAAEVKKEIESLMSGAAIDIFKQQEALRLAEEYEKLGVLNRRDDADLFAILG